MPAGSTSASNCIRREKTRKCRTIGNTVVSRQASSSDWKQGPAWGPTAQVRCGGGGGNSRSAWKFTV